MDSEVLVIGIILAAGLAFIPASIAKRKGYSFGLWWVYGCMLFIVAVIHVSLIPNKNTPQETVSKSVPPELGIAEELKKYKDLLDSGAITEDEFQAKKQDLLK